MGKHFHIVYMCYYNWLNPKLLMACYELQVCRTLLLTRITWQFAKRVSFPWAFRFTRFRSPVSGPVKHEATSAVSPSPRRESENSGRPKRCSDSKAPDVQYHRKVTYSKYPKAEETGPTERDGGEGEGNIIWCDIIWFNSIHVIYYNTIEYHNIL